MATMRCDAMRCDAMRCDAMRCESVPTLTLRAGQALGSEAAGSSRRGEQQPDPASGQRLQPAQVLRVAREAPALGAGAVTRTPITGSIKLTIDCVSDTNLRVVSCRVCVHTPPINAWRSESKWSSVSCRRDWRLCSTMASRRVRSTLCRTGTSAKRP